MKNKSVVILGCSKSCEEIDKYTEVCCDITKYFIENGFNVITGCGTNGIMGQVYKTAAQNSIKEKGKPVQNQVIVRKPLWGDEDLDNCVLIDEAVTEAERLHKFMQFSDKFIIFPGGITTMQEATTLIQENRHNDYDKKIVLFGEDFWAGLIDQYKTIFNKKVIKENPIGKEFFIANTKEEVIEIMKNDVKA